MGYASYDLNDGHGLRGYAVDATCAHPGCEMKINKGIGYLCHRCTKYFCESHLSFAFAADGDTEIKFDCFAGESSRCCLQCCEAVEVEALEGTT